MTNVEKEAEKYKNLPTKKLKQVIRQYKSLSRSNYDMYNFLFSFILMIIFGVLFLKITFLEYLHKYKKFKLVSDEDKEEIDEIIKILESYLSERETKNPSE
jgi:hypothetical protein